MESPKTLKWLRIISLWALFTSLLGICFYVLIQIGIIDDKPTKLDLFVFIFNTIGGLVIFAGIWRLESWGWKTAVVLIPVSWAISAYAMAVDYYRGMGIFSAPFILIDAFILRYLFRHDIIEFFRITSRILLRLKWCARGLFFMALFLAVNDIFWDIVGVITVIAVLAGFQTIRKRVRLEDSKI